MSKNDLSTVLTGALTMLLSALLALKVNNMIEKDEGRQTSEVRILGLSFDKDLISMAISALAMLLSLLLLVGKSASTKDEEVIKAVETKPAITPKKPTTSVPPAVSNGPKLGNRTTGNTFDVVVVGTGLPKKGMGWYHLTQLLEMENTNVRAVIEPFFLNTKLCSTPPESFRKMVSDLKSAGVACEDSISKLPKFTKDTMCLIAGRTGDNPKLFKQCLDQGAKVIYLEKPGAPSVAELEVMRDQAEEKGVKVYLGYNKNVTSYVQNALKLSKEVENSTITFCHNNSYKKNELNECFSRNSEGMLKNMAIHELALLVSFFDVTVATIDKFELQQNKLFTEKLAVWIPGTVVPDEKYISDFSRIGFKVTTKAGKSVCVMADRCGGNVSFASVRDGSGVEVQKFEFPDAETLAKVDELCIADPDMMPYFFIQSDDYDVLKRKVVDSSLAGKDADGVATIQIAIEALKLAEYFTEEANKILAA